MNIKEIEGKSYKEISRIDGIIYAYEVKHKTNITNKALAIILYGNSERNAIQGAFSFKKCTNMKYLNMAVAKKFCEHFKCTITDIIGV